MQAQHLARILEALPPGTEVEVRGHNSMFTRRTVRVEVSQGKEGLEVVIITAGDTE